MSEFIDKQVILTGSAGFLGSLLYTRLRSVGAKVMPIDPVQNGARAEDLGKYIHPDEVDYIIHCAGIASPRKYRENPLGAVDASVAGTRAVLDLARVKGARVLYFSSSEIYGDPPNEWIPTPERYFGNVDPLGARSCYDESKRMGEALCKIYDERFGVRSVIVRPFNFYGPTMAEDDYRMLPNLRRAVRANQPVCLYGNGQQTRTFCYVDDGLTGCLLALLKGKSCSPYNIGAAGPELTMHQLMSRAATAIKQPITVETVMHPPEYPADEPKRRCPDVRKAKNELGFQATTGIMDGLRRFFECSG